MSAGGTQPTFQRCPKIDWDDLKTPDKKFANSLGNHQNLRDWARRGANVTNAVCHIYGHLAKRDLDTLKLLAELGFSYKDKCAVIAFGRGGPDKDLEKLEYLISEGADVNCRYSPRSTTLLHRYFQMEVAKKEPFTTEDEKLLRRLLNVGANENVNQYAYVRDEDGLDVRRSVWAMEDGPRYLPMFKILVEYGLDPYSRQYHVYKANTEELVHKNGINPMIQAVFSARSFEDKKSAVLTFVNEFGYDINTRYNLVWGGISGSDNMNLLTEWSKKYPRDDEFQGWLLDQGAEYLE